MSTAAPLTEGAEGGAIRGVPEKGPQRLKAAHSTKTARVLWDDRPAAARRKVRRLEGRAFGGEGASAP